MRALLLAVAMTSAGVAARGVSPIDIVVAHLCADGIAPWCVAARGFLLRPGGGIQLLMVYLAGAHQCHRAGSSRRRVACAIYRSA